MALNKQITLENGISYNYHRIANTRLDAIEENGSIVYNLRLHVLGYVSEDIRDSGTDKYVVANDYSFRITEEESESNLRNVGYNYIKLMKEFEDAIDC